MFCTNCGNPVDEGAAFCTKCGAKTNATGESSDANSAPNVPHPIQNGRLFRK